jgi:NAD(P)-dependent dehydrogenase (short-subunit alcohol dehydrogenase family)
MLNNYILITGATSDIGIEIASHLTSNYNLILHGRDYDKLKSLESKLNSNKKVILWTCDLNKTEVIQQNLKDLIEKNLIGIEKIIHAAGVVKILPFKHFKSEYYSEIFRVNFFSAVEIIQTCLLRINQGKLNNILFISALFSKRGDRGNSMYSASKGAIDTLVKSLAVELAPNIRVNSILPGAINTRMTNHLFLDDDFKSKILSNYPLGEGKPSDVANLVCFLISENSSWITGQNIFLDGGRSAL